MHIHPEHICKQAHVFVDRTIERHTQHMNYSEKKKVFIIDWNARINYHRVLIVSLLNRSHITNETFEIRIVITICRLFCLIQRKTTTTISTKTESKHYSAQ